MAETQTSITPNPDVLTLDNERINERSALSYFHNHWSSYKGHYRGMLNGMGVGGILAGAIGGVVAFATGSIFFVPLFSAVGALMGGESFGIVGAAASSRAAALADKHARILDPMHGGDTLSALDDKLMHDGRGHHYEYPANRDVGKFFNIKSGFTGLAAGGLFGGLLGLGTTIATHAGTAGLTGALSHAGIALSGATLTHIGAMVAAVGLGSTLLPVVIGVAIFGALGLTFGIERSVLKSFFNQTDANARGDVLASHGHDIGRSQYQGTESQLNDHRIRRQEEISKLEKLYYGKIFDNALVGRFRGFAAGAVAGAVIGLALGGIGLGILALAGVAAVSAGVALPVITGLGLLFGMKLFSDVATEAGAESSARAIDEEFDRNIEARKRGITLARSPAQEKGNWFNIRPAITMGLLGAAAGVALAPFMAFGLLPAVITSALVGTTYGIGSNFFRGMRVATSKAYDASYFSKEEVAPAYPNVPAPQLVNGVTAEDMSKINERVAARESKGFVDQLAAKPSPHASHVMG